MNGWIKLWRKIEDWGWYRKRDHAHLFIHLILNARHEDGEVAGRMIHRGQVLIGQDYLSSHTGVSRQTIRTILTHLKSTNDITTESTSVGTIVTIVNYNTYQPLKDDVNQPINQQINHKLTSDQPAINQRSTTNKKERREEGKKEKKTERFVAPSAEMVTEYAKSIDFDLDGEKFVDFYASKGWKVGKTPMENWQACVRTWQHNGTKEKSQNGRHEPRQEFSTTSKYGITINTDE